MTEGKKRLQMWQWAVILLVLCNTGLIATIWLRPHMHPGDKGPAREYVINNLKFTGEQVKAYDVLIHGHRAAMDSLQKKGMEYRAALFACLRGGGTEAAGADSLVRLIADNQGNIEQVTYRHFEQVRKIGTDAQKTKFDDIIGEVIKIMNGPGRGGPPPGEERNPHP